VRENSLQICSKKWSLISYVQELSESKHKQYKLFTPRLVD